MKDFLKLILIVVFYPFTLLYQFLFFLDKTIKKKYKLPSTVWSVGNLSVGGTGKTPFTLSLLKLILNKRNTNIVVLSRGYGGRLSKNGALVGPNSTTDEVGDEPMMVYKNYPNIQMIIGRNRYKSFHTYYKNKSNPDLILLDDGFQHHSLDRDLDIVLIDTSKPLDRFVLPLGKLREPLSALKRANVIVFSKWESCDKSLWNNWVQKIEGLNPTAKIIYFSFEIKYLENCLGNRIHSDFSSYNAFLFSGIGNPDSFFNLVKNRFSNIEGLEIYLDHHNYSEKDIHHILEKSKNSDIIVSTEKDFIKCKNLINYSNNPKFYYLKIEGNISDEDFFIQQFKSIR
jgi:tetraacyldisaccharide 4'-kinase